MELNGDTSTVTGIILPDEILSLICQELGKDKDFDTLYRCALSAKSLADPALRTMYQYHELSPAFIQSEEADLQQKGGRPETYQEKVVQQEELFRNWTLLWRSIIASSFVDGRAKTYKPYCRYLRILDFRNLKDMLDDLKFSQSVKRSFYAAPLSRLHHPEPDPKMKRQGVNIVATCNDVGDIVIPKASLLEEISGNLAPGYTARWVAQAPRLTNMVLFEGNALRTGAGAAIAKHCEFFTSLTVVKWMDEDADRVCADFFNELNEDTVQYFELISSSLIARSSFEALGRHKSLRELRLASLSREAMENLNGLKGCTELHTLLLEDSGAVQLEALNNDVFLDVVYWLSSCTKLKDITLKKFVDGPALLAQVAVAPSVRWSKLTLESGKGYGYALRHQSAAQFHTALAEQTELEMLALRGSGEDSTPDDLNIMVESICRLTNLKALSLKDVSDEFEETHIINLAMNLPLLEELWTSGGEVSANILQALTNPKNLKQLELLALTQFTLDDVLDFLGQLNPQRQKGFVLNLMAVDQQYNMSNEELSIIHEYMLRNLDGRFGELTFFSCLVKTSKLGLPCLGGRLRSRWVSQKEFLLTRHALRFCPLARGIPER